MRTQNISKRLFRLFASMIVFVMAFSQVSGVAQAQDAKPPKGLSKVTVPSVDLSEVQRYYDHIGGAQGIIGVVVELKNTPAGLIYADPLQALPSDAKTDSAQVNLIEQKQNDVMSAVSASGIQSTEMFRTQKAYNGIWLRVDANDLQKLAKIPGIKALHPIIPKTIDHTTSVPLIGAPQVWGGSGTYQGTGIKIGIIDTGVDYIHTNFGGLGVYTGQDYTTIGEAGNLFPTAKVVGGWDFAGDAYNADPASPSYNPTPSPDPDPMDCYGHGSHVAGTVAGYGVDTSGATYVESGGDTYATLGALSSSAYIAKFRIGPGVAPKADLYSLRIFGCEGSTDLTELAIEWAMDPNGDANLSDHLDVINMSLGSDYGSGYDTSAVASNNAAAAGVIVVAASGNAGDVYYITSAPASASNAISVASSIDGGAIVSAFEVATNTAASPLVPAGNYPAAGAGFGPQSYTPVSAELAQLSDLDKGCSAYTAGTFTGKIALINRGTCNFTVKVKNAQNAGAIGVLLANNIDSAPSDMGGTDVTVTIPSMITTKALGTDLRADMAAGVVTVVLTTAHRNSFFMSQTAFEDTVSSFSSRGLARAGSMLKPDIAAPGETIFSTENGTGNQGASFNGTSMATPHVAGVMALLKQIHPTWTVAELKALAMNTATNDLWTDTTHTAVHTPTRVGAGRVSVANAALSSVVAYNAADPGEVSLSFGEQAILGVQSFTKSVTIKNTGVADASYNVTIDKYYQANPGLTFTLLNAGGTALANPVTVTAGSTLNIKVQVDADAALLSRAHDASIAPTGLYDYRHYISEGGGYVTLTSTATDPTLRVPFHIAARPASAMSVTETSVVLPAPATGILSLHPSGLAVDTVDDTSLVSILSLTGTSPNESYTDSANDYADLRYIGATSDYPTHLFASSAMYFGISTYGKWDTPNSVEFDIYVDINEDGVYDYVVFNYNESLFGGNPDVMFTSYCELPSWSNCNADYATNGYGGNVNTNLFNNNVMLMPVMLTSIGLVDGVNTDFNFYVASSSREGTGYMDVSDVMSYDVAHQAFTAVDTVNTAMPMWLDALAYSPTFDVTYNKSALALGDAKGLLLLHHHNAAANTAEVLYVPQVSISGNAGVGGATLTYTGGSATANSAGDYSFQVPSGWSGTVTPSKAGYFFTPANTVYSNVTVDQLNQNYVATHTIAATFRSTGTQDGWVLESTATSNVGGTMNSAAPTFNVGDDAAKKQYRGVLSFNTNSLPNTAVITSATLKVKKSGMAGNPFTGHGPLLIDIRKPFFGPVAGLQITDFQASANAVAGSFSSTPAANGWYIGTLTNLGKSFVNRTGTTQFRLRFQLGNDADAIADYMRFFSGNNAIELMPQLVIQYYIP